MQHICLTLSSLNCQLGDTSDNPFWNFVRNLIDKPSPEQIQCQAPKPIVLNTGGLDRPFEWSPKIVPVQILRVGQLFILAVPGEFT